MSTKTLIRKFGETILVRRFNSGGVIQQGDYVDSGYAEFTTYASVQELTGREMVDEQISRRTENMLKVYTNTELFTTDKAIGRKADIICWKNREYEVQSVEDWQQCNTRHYKCMVRKVTNQ